ncbi:hypothetical protein KAU32_11235 [bacterium]|nr:hypothetical protein [bacterium]
MIIQNIADFSDYIFAFIPLNLLTKAVIVVILVNIVVPVLKLLLKHEVQAQTKDEFDGIIFHRKVLCTMLFLFYGIILFIILFASHFCRSIGLILIPTIFLFFIDLVKTIFRLIEWNSHFRSELRIKYLYKLTNNELKELLNTIIEINDLSKKEREKYFEYFLKKISSKKLNANLRLQLLESLNSNISLYFNEDIFTSNFKDIIQIHYIYYQKVSKRKNQKKNIIDDSIVEYGKLIKNFFSFTNNPNNISSSYGIVREQLLNAGLDSKYGKCSISFYWDIIVTNPVNSLRKYVQNNEFLIINDLDWGFSNILINRLIEFCSEIQGVNQGTKRIYYEKLGLLFTNMFPSNILLDALLVIFGILQDNMPSPTSEYIIYTDEIRKELTFPIEHDHSRSNTSAEICLVLKILYSHFTREVLEQILSQGNNIICNLSQDVKEAITN